MDTDKILVLDGAMGTEIMRRGLGEIDFRGERFVSHPSALRGNNDILCLTRPDVIEDIHRSYVDAGADIIETCTFNAQSVSQADYGLEGEVLDEINREAVRIARHVADATPRKVYVAGSVGPTPKMISLGQISYDELHEAYLRQMSVLIQAGVDTLLIETCIDTLNAKCALEAAMEAMEQVGRNVRLMVSLTVADSGGHLLSGSTIEAFVDAISHAPLWSVGINCSLGAEGLLPFLRQLRACSPVKVSCHPNAGLPDKTGRYLDTPEIMAAHIEKYLKEGLVDIIGGCCGTTPEHIRQIRQTVTAIGDNRKYSAPKRSGITLAGTESLRIPEGTFINVGERCNVAGSRKFLRLISSGEFEEAAAIARKQVEDGAMVIDINMDDALLDAPGCMERFLKLLGEDPVTAALPVMVDSSRWEVIERALKCIQGKPIVNSLSLKEGEDVFRARAKKIRRMGAALVVMAFDEDGQATTFDRKIEVCGRAYRILTDELGFPPEDIIFDPNILTVATGITEHADYALDFVRATDWIRANLPGAGVSGGVSNLSFAFRGNNFVREAMHAVFLYHAIRAGLTMAIINPATTVTYDSIPADLRNAIEDVLFNTRTPEATERLTLLAQEAVAPEAAKNIPQNEPTQALTLDERLSQALITGSTATLDADLAEAIAQGRTPLEIISGPLMAGMDRVGELFGQGKMFLPQVVKTARTMKVAVDILTSRMETAATDASAAKRGRILMATVKGDVHDIGKNIVGIILECNGYEIIDLGVMVSPEKIVEESVAQNVDIVCLSGLITPSLEEMRIVAAMMQQASLTIPLMIGGATTSALHTALRIAPEYPDGVVLHMADASQNPLAAAKLLDPTAREAYISEVKVAQLSLRETNGEVADYGSPESISPSDSCCVKMPAKIKIGTFNVAELRPHINWLYFSHAWKMKTGTVEERDLRADAEKLLDKLEASSDEFYTRYEQAFYEAKSVGNGIEISGLLMPTPRQKNGEQLALCDFVNSEYPEVGIFATTVSEGIQREISRLKSDPLMQYEMLLWQTLADRLAEATSELAHKQTGFSGIRPAVGYPSLPDQRAIFILDRLMPLSEIGIALTENGAMSPSSSTAGLYLPNPSSRYFSAR